MRRNTAALLCIVLLCALAMPSSMAWVGTPDPHRPIGAARMAMDADGLAGQYILPADGPLARGLERVGAHGAGPLWLPIALVLMLALWGRWAQLYWHASRAFRQHVLVPHSIHAPPPAHP